MKIGLIGLGAMGKNHLRVLRTLPGVELVGAVDTDPARLAEVLEGTGVPGYLDAGELAGKVDAVGIATPTEHHHRLGMQFLRQGCAVMMEKPIARTLEEADELVAEAHRCGQVLAVGHLERFNPAVQYADRYVSRPLFIEIQRLGSFSPRSLDIDVILDLMIHDLDILLHWDKSGVTALHAVGVPILSAKVDLANVRLQFASGLVANVTASRVSQGKTRTLRLFQANRYLSLDYQARTLKIVELDGRSIRQIDPPVEPSEPLANLWREFCTQAAGNSRGCVTAAEGRAALELALQVSRSITPP
jgi:predicted dehydrogenase